MAWPTKLCASTSRLSGCFRATMHRTPYRPTVTLTSPACLRVGRVALGGGRFRTDLAGRGRRGLGMQSLKALREPGLSRRPAMASSAWTGQPLPSWRRLLVVGSAGVGPPFIGIAALGRGAPDHASAPPVDWVLDVRSVRRDQAQRLRIEFASRTSVLCAMPPLTTALCAIAKANV